METTNKQDMTETTVENPLILNETRQTIGEALVEPRLSVETAKVERKKSDKPWLWSKEQAIEFAKKGYEAKLAKAAATKAALEEAAKLKAQLIESATLPADEQYRLERLQRTRKQLSQLDEQLEGETDPKAVKAICDAIARLAEVERILAGRLFWCLG